MQIIISFWDKSLLWTNSPPKVYPYQNWMKLSPCFTLSSSANLIFSCCLSNHTCNIKTSPEISFRVRKLINRAHIFAFLPFSMISQPKLTEILSPNRLCSSAVSAFSGQSLTQDRTIHSYWPREPAPRTTENKGVCLLEPDFLLLLADLLLQGLLCLRNRVVKFLYSKILTVYLTRSSSMD